MLMKIVVGSKNPVKIEATRMAFERAFPDEEIEVVGKSVKSGVSDNPMTDEETYTGAKNRAEALYKDFLNEYDFFVGIEGGVDMLHEDMIAFAWIFIIYKDGRVNSTRSAFFKLPKKVAELVKQGYELGTADDMVFKDKNSKQKQGAVGILTKNILTRTSFYADTLIFTLIPFMWEDLY